jgi:hypothetical protein
LHKNIKKERFTKHFFPKRKKMNQYDWVNVNCEICDSDDMKIYQEALYELRSTLNYEKA